jgi:hypothetical protein
MDFYALALSIPAGVSEHGIKDDRLNVGAEITLTMAGNNKIVREVRLAMRRLGAVPSHRHRVKKL